VVSVPRPYIKAAGGKTSSLPELLARIPSEIRGDYVEPFIGGGALFWEMRRLEAAGERSVRGCYLVSDVHPALVVTLRAVRDDVDDLMRRLDGMKLTEAAYYKVRDFDPLRDIAPGSPGKAAAVGAWFIYLNKTCFNGLYRTNKAGRFNTPWGKRTNVALYDEENLRACSRALNRYTSIGLADMPADFEKILDSCTDGDFVYCDPPYVPMGGTANFTAYAKANFRMGDQTRLAEAARRAAKRGALVMLSNHDLPSVRELYAGAFHIERLEVRRNINSNGAKRGGVGELVMTSYDPHAARFENRKAVGA
jgi:DNA adenine methylase